MGYALVKEPYFAFRTNSSEGSPRWWRLNAKTKRLVDAALVQLYPGIRSNLI